MAMWSMICGLTTTIDLTTKISHPPKKINCRIDKENPSAKGESWAKLVKSVRDNLKSQIFLLGLVFLSMSAIFVSKKAVNNEKWKAQNNSFDSWSKKINPSPSANHG